MTRWIGKMRTGRTAALLVACLGIAGFAMRTEAGGAPNWVQEHYQWRNDNGSESAATWKASADTAISGVTNTNDINKLTCT